ncbi:hypothetical protein LSAT2_001564 [Lamellibrachia satsuma]|nr:hypothetical protein LSAT2_001564 [Lamellibrachia satsuma]
MFALRQLVEKRLEMQGRIAVGFVEVEKAYDTVPREMVTTTVRWMGVPQTEARMMEVMYERTKGRMVVGSGLSEELGTRMLILSWEDIAFKQGLLWSTPLGSSFRTRTSTLTQPRLTRTAFSPENRKKLPAFAFEPFGFAGKRKCMGWKFSITEATIVFAAIVGSLKLSMVPDQVVVPDYGFVTKPSEEIWITVTKRS